MRDNEDADRPPRHLWRSADDEEEGEDPLITLGHMVKLASIGIWRKVASRDKKTRPGMQERSSSDSVLEVTRPVTYADDENANRVAVDLDEPAADTSDDKPLLPQAETTTKTGDGEEVETQTQPVSAVQVPTEEP